MSRPKVPREVRRGFWRLVARGVSTADAAASIGVSAGTGWQWFRQAGGMSPLCLAEPSGRYLSFAEREEIACGLAAKVSMRDIADGLGRAASSVSREVKRNASPRRQTGYRASVAQENADQRAAGRPRPRKLELVELREVVQERLRWKWSPRQIADHLAVTYPDRPEMRVSHETIYQALYVQGRGSLRRELTACLRTGRALRVPHRRTEARPSGIPDLISISDRPAEVADRAVPGHWEGDLIIGRNHASAIGTLVERSTRYCLLLHLPGRYGAEQVRDAMIAKVGQLPAHLWRSLTWDRGIEMVKHREITIATGLPIYFCDPASPWQRGSNENTNGLLRQYFPKSTDLSTHDADHLDFVAAELNARPRKTLGGRTPAQALNELLSQPYKPAGVATRT